MNHVIRMRAGPRRRGHPLHRLRNDAGRKIMGGLHVWEVEYAGLCTVRRSRSSRRRASEPICGTWVTKAHQRRCAAAQCRYMRVAVASLSATSGIAAASGSREPKTSSSSHSMVACSSAWVVSK